MPQRSASIRRTRCRGNPCPHHCSSVAADAYSVLVLMNRGQGQGQVAAQLAAGFAAGMAAGMAAGIAGVAGIESGNQGPEGPDYNIYMPSQNLVYNNWCEDTPSWIQTRGYIWPSHQKIG